MTDAKESNLGVCDVRAQEASPKLVKIRINVKSRG